MIERRYQYGQYVQEFYYPKLNSLDKNSRGDAVKEPRVIKHSARGGSQEGEGEDRTMANYPYMRGDKARRSKKLKSNVNTPSNQRIDEYTPDNYRDVISSNLHHDIHGINQSYTNNNQVTDSASRIPTKSYKITPNNYSHRAPKPDSLIHDAPPYGPPSSSPHKNPHVTKSVKVVNHKKPYTKNSSSRNQEYSIPTQNDIKKMYSEKGSKGNMYRIKGAQPNTNIFIKKKNFFEEGGWGNNDGGRADLDGLYGNIFENQYVNAGMGGGPRGGVLGEAGDGWGVENNKSRQLANVSQNYNHVQSGGGGNIS
jgi:hypothetical protein